MAEPLAARVAAVVPNTVGFMSAAWLRGRRRAVRPGPPVPRISPALAAQVAMDEAVLAVMLSPRRYPRRADYERVGAEVLAVLELYESRGWLDDPRAYHPEPPPLDPALVRLTHRRGRVLGLSYEHLSFPSGYAPWSGEPGRERWAAHVANRTSHAWLLRHDDDRPRPWLVCVHGFGMGSPRTDFAGFRAARLHRELGLNLALPVLPLHGPRRTGHFSGSGAMSFDLLDTVHAVAQGAWDIRRLLAFLVEAQPAPPAIGIYGLSLGANVAALVAGLPGPARGSGVSGGSGALDLVIAGIPASDLLALFAHHTPARLRRRARAHHMLGEEPGRVFRVVSPLAVEPSVPPPRRYIFAGLGDRMSTPWQAQRLWEHWGGPEISWYAGNHVGFFWSKEAARFVEEALADAGFLNGPRRVKAA